ncbi:MAG: TlpA disulfide reductase family protein [Thalassobaculum sp.]|uniref:TlpA family protein disulfide reductase n=1 Tax=Thalassobaculum sp. TaxID=2022740 RepID=UPI0032EAFC28
MTRQQRRWLSLTVGVAGGLVLGVAVAGLLDSGSEPSVVAAVAAGSGSRPAVMSLHEEPRPVPELRFEVGDGRPLALSELRGKVVLLNIWATWCGPCRAEMPTLDRLQAGLGGPDFEVVALSIDRAGIEAVDRFYAEIGVKHLGRYIDVTAKAARDLGAYGLPTTLLIDRDGREVARHVGPAEWDTPSMTAFFRGQLSRRAGAAGPDTTTTSNKEGVPS